MFHIQRCWFQNQELWKQNSLSDWTGLWLDHCSSLLLFFFSHSVVGLLLCMELLSCSMTQLYLSDRSVLRLGSRIFCYAGVYSMTAKCSDPVAAKQNQIITPPPPGLTTCRRCLCWYAMFVFHQMWCCALWTETSTLVWCFVQMQLCKPNKRGTVTQCQMQLFCPSRVTPCGFDKTPPPKNRQIWNWSTTW